MRISDWSSDVCSSDLWAKGLLRTQHLILSYEGMLSQTEKSVAEILNFIGLAINISALRNAIAAAQFDRMQEQERAQGIPGHEYDRSDVLSLRMRSGKAGSFPELLGPQERSEEHTSELQSLMRISYAVFCLKNNN